MSELCDPMDFSTPDLPVLHYLPEFAQVHVHCIRMVKAKGAQSCPTLCDLMDCRMSGSSVLHYLPEFAQIHVHWVGDAVSSPTISSSDASFSFSLQSFLAPSTKELMLSNCGAGEDFSNELALHIRWPKYWASASVLPMNIQGWFPLGSEWYHLFI